MARLEGISVFVEVVEANGFSAAAARLNLTRSAVAKTISRLEERLRVRLFHRTTRSLSLTDQGNLFYERCLKALEEIRLGEALLETGRTHVRGKLRVTMPVLYGRQCVAPILIGLLDDHPDLELELSFNDRIVDLVDDGFDLAIRNGPLKDNAALMTRTLTHKRMIVCASPVYLEKHGTPKAADEIEQHYGLVYNRADYDRTWIFPTKDHPLRQIKPQCRLRLDDLDVIVQAAIDGRGLAWLPSWLIGDRLANGELIAILTDVASIAYDIHAVWLKSPIMLPKVRLAIEHLAQKLA
jgi:DNA-binding transcriptional LysR family regulator